MLITVNGCATTRCSNELVILPEMPTAGKEVANELDKFCLPDKGQCKNINNWLNDLYIFKLKYNIIKENYE